VQWPNCRQACLKFGCSGVVDRRSIDYHEKRAQPINEVVGTKVGNFIPSHASRLFLCVGRRCQSRPCTEYYACSIASPALSTSSSAELVYYVGT
jgi:hypothetical protein